MWLLLLNDMRASQVEIVNPRLVAETKELLVDYLESQVDPWRDGQWGKTYRKGSDLEWFNPPFASDNCFQDIGTADKWADDARAGFADLVGSVREVTV